MSGGFFILFLVVSLATAIGLGVAALMRPRKLGPGSNAAHAEHMHVDILQHGSSDRYRICQ
jgi:hypothetical protein